MNELKRPADRSLILGVDPGITGALALFDPISKQIIATYPMPVTEGPCKAHDSTGGRKTDPVGLAILLEKIENHVAFAVVEEVGARPQQGVVSTFTLGMGTGMVHGALAGRKIPVYLVRPDVWKILLGVTRNKETSLKKATSLFPRSRHFWPTTAASGHAEAALLAYFGQRLQKPKKENPSV